MESWQEDSAKYMEKKLENILVLIAYFFPGYKSGGPQQTAANVIETFGREAHFYVLTLNHDLGEDDAYDVETNKWIKYGRGYVKYLAVRQYNYKNIKKEYNKFNIVYSCGLFEKNTIMILLIHRFAKHKKRLYIAPMGVFSHGAIKQKRIKKMIFLSMAKLTGLFRNIIWSFTSTDELHDIGKVIGEAAVRDYIIAADLPRRGNSIEAVQKLKTYTKEPGVLKIVYLSRICSKKNLDYGLNILKGIRGSKIYFDIFGILEDKKYWSKCKSIIGKMPQNCRVNYCGELHPKDVMDIFSGYDVFLFPTKGENFGHVIYEALSAGCIPVISDTTPWKDFDKEGCGKVICLREINKFRSAIYEYSKMDGKQLLGIKERCIKYAGSWYKKTVAESGYRSIYAD